MSATKGSRDALTPSGSTSTVETKSSSDLAEAFSQTSASESSSGEFTKTLPSHKEPNTRESASQEDRQLMHSLLDAISQNAEDLGGHAGAGRTSIPSTGVEEDHTGYHGRVDSLRRVKTTLDRLYWTESDLMTRAAEVLADRSRAPEWRLPFGESGVLDFYLNVIVTHDHSYDLMHHALRLIGNCCADTDDNRRRVVEQNHLPSIIHQLCNPPLVQIALNVIYNVCMDYEPAQQQAIQQGLLVILIQLLSDQIPNQIRMATDENLLKSVCRVMEELVTAPQAIEYSPENAIDVLLETACPSQLELDDFVSLVNLVVAHLASPRFQRLLISQQAVERLLSAMVESYSRYSRPDESIHAISDLDITPRRRGSSPTEDTETLSLMRRGALEVLSDVSALPEFALMYPLNSPLIGSLRMWLSVPQTQLRICACLMLGNLARSNEVCWIMVHDFKIHEPLLQMLRESNDSQLLHAAAGFLKNLCLMTENKDVVARAGLFDAVSRLWAMDSLPQMQYSGAGLARQAVNGSYKNIQRLLASLSPDPDSPAHSRTYLSLLLYLCKRTDQTATKIEIARTITAILRVLNSPTPPAPMAEIRGIQRRLYSLHPDLARPLAVLACQDKWSVNRSEAWFTFALMARDEIGAAAVDDVVTDVDLVRVLVEIVTGKRIAGGVDSEETYFEMMTGQESPEGSPGTQRKLAEMKRIDRENGLVLISKLLENRGDDIPPMRKEIFRDILQGKEIMHQSFGQLTAAARSTREQIDLHTQSYQAEPAAYNDPSPSFSSSSAGPWEVPPWG
ncbi:MAG: hypothetical protein M1816_000613 [Peltula sp. TS41687]|nr:MAG: hypothetical protein M1816_000613 [Peltula sp. TS41687]